jgi:hypothetical protein
MRLAVTAGSAGWGEHMQQVIVEVAGGSGEPA